MVRNKLDKVCKVPFKRLASKKNTNIESDTPFHYEQNYDGHLCISNLVCTHDHFPQIVLEVKMSFDCWLVGISL